ncbi:MAG TPA: hypothetical protein VFK82_04035 [Burkholderiaceae bacterium]|nr:hypothetical protein [Burkholderiaceae bacterium]
MQVQADLLADYWALKHQPAPPVMAQGRYINRGDLYEVVLSVFLKNPADRVNLPSG